MCEYNKSLNSDSQLYVCKNMGKPMSEEEGEGVKGVCMLKPTRGRRPHRY